MEELWLTTIDNPFNPFTDFDRWYEYDESHGYHSLQILGRICNVSHNLNDNDYNEEANSAIIDFIQSNPFGIFIKVTKSSVIKPIQISKLIENQEKS